MRRVVLFVRVQVLRVEIERITHKLNGISNPVEREIYTFKLAEKQAELRILEEVIN